MVDVDRVTANLRHMAAFEAKPNVRPLPDTAVTRGFEKVAFPKLVSRRGGARRAGRGGGWGQGKARQDGVGWGGHQTQRQVAALLCPPPAPTQMT